MRVISSMFKTNWEQLGGLGLDSNRILSLLLIRPAFSVGMKMPSSMISSQVWRLGWRLQDSMFHRSKTYITGICFVLREEGFETETTHNGDKKE